MEKTVWLQANGLDVPVYGSGCPRVTWAESAKQRFDLLEAPSKRLVTYWPRPQRPPGPYSSFA